MSFIAVSLAPTIYFNNNNLFISTYIGFVFKTALYSLL